MLRPRGMLLVLLALLSCSREERLNVVLFTLDTTRADHIGCYGNERIETPNIDRLAARGVRFDNAFTVVPITLPSHLAMMSGTYPIFHGVRENGGFYVPPEITTLAEILDGDGYDTAAFVGAFPLDSQTGLDQGFDLYDDNYAGNQRQHPSLRRFYDERPAAEVARSVRVWLSERSRSKHPFFLWSHFFDAHQPLTPPAFYRERYPHSLYDAEIASVDEAIGQILERLKELDLLDSTLIVLTADHGEGLGEHGEQTHALLLHSSTLRVPLIVDDPQQQESGVIKAPVSTLDIFSTVLERLGLEIPGANQGVPLPRTENEADPEREILSETMFGSLVYGWSPIYRLTRGEQVHLHGPRDRLFDRAADAGELQDLAADQSERLEQMQRALRAHRRRAGEGGFRFSRGTVSLETRNRLEALGYLTSTPTPRATLSDEVDVGRPDPPSMMPVFDLQNEAHGLIDRGVFDLAVPILQRALELDPTNPMVLINLAQARLGLGDFSRGREVLDRLLALRPDDVTSLQLLSQFHRDRGELDQAVRYLEQVIDADASDQRSLLQLAHLLEDTGRTDDSQAAYRVLLEQEPHHADAANGLATLLYRSGEVDEAVKALERALDAQPYHAPATLNLAVIRFDQGHSDLARQLAERAVALRPRYPQARELLRRLELANSPADGSSN